MLSIVAAGLLALPSLLVQVITIPVVAILAIPSLTILMFRKPRYLSTAKLNASAHVIVTGGSSGIGLSLAKECVMRGVSRVTILARNVDKLEASKKELQSLDATGKVEVEAHSVDVSDSKSLENTAKAVMKGKASESVYLFCCAGQAEPHYFEDSKPENFEKAIKTNQLGSIYSTRAFLPYIKSGTICLCSSMGGQIGVFGFSSYSPTKFALRGFAECLHMELCNSPVHVQIAFPPDTDTPGYELENRSKPKETHLVSEQGGLSKPEQVAKVMLKEATSPTPRFYVYFTFEGWMLCALTSGMSPVSTLGDALSQVSAMSLFRFVSLFYLKDWWTIIRKYQQESKVNEEKTK